MTLYFIAAGIFLLGLCASTISLFFRKTRKIGKYGMAGLTCIFITGAISIYIMTLPIEFSRPYLKENINIASLTVKENANNANVYIGGAPSDINHMLMPEFIEVFNSVTPENDLKISNLLDINTLKYDFTAADKMVDASLENNIRVRGHALIFGKLSDTYKQPDFDLWLEQFPENTKKEQLSNLFNRHIETVLEHYKGRILEWDVINEPLDMFGNGKLEENVFYRYLGKEYIEQAFLKAKFFDPNVTLYLNEQFYNYTDDRADAFYQLVVSLLNKGIPVEGIGLQGHMLFYLATPADTAAYVKRFTELGLRVQLTEFEARLRLFKDSTDPYQAQGEYYRDVMKACYNIDGFDGITFWGVDDSKSWLNDMSWLFPLPNEPYLLDHHKNAKPGLVLINELIKTL